MMSVVIAITIADIINIDSIVTVINIYQFRRHPHQPPSSLGCRHSNPQNKQKHRLQALGNSTQSSPAISNQTEFVVYCLLRLMSGLLELTRGSPENSTNTRKDPTNGRPIFGLLTETTPNPKPQTTHNNPKL